MDTKEIPVANAAESSHHLSLTQFLAGLALTKKPLMSASVQKDLRPFPTLCQ